MRTRQLVCALALFVGALACYSVGAGAQGTDAERQACTPDAMRLCGNVVPDIARTTACMKANFARLSPECRLAIRAGSGGGHGTYRHRTYRHHQYPEHRHCHHCG
jgi:hypothetical protein